MGGFGETAPGECNSPCSTLSSQDDEEPPALPPRTLEGLQLEEEEPVYEAEPEPEPEPENDYEDVGEIDKYEQDDEQEGDYEDVLEPENPSTLAGEWWGAEEKQLLNLVRSSRG